MKSLPFHSTYYVPVIKIGALTELLVILTTLDYLTNEKS